MEMGWKPNVEVSPPCPRCGSSNTKFCYYNNYSLTQPRYFCKGCRRYWTKGGSLRNVPVGGGCRKTRRSKSTRAANSTNNDRLQISSTSPADQPSTNNIDLAAVYANFVNHAPPQVESSNSYLLHERTVNVPPSIEFSNINLISSDVHVMNGSFFECEQFPGMFPVGFAAGNSSFMSSMDDHIPMHELNDSNLLPPLPGEEGGLPTWPNSDDAVLQNHQIMINSDQVQRPSDIHEDNSALVSANMSMFSGLNLGPIFRG